MFSKRTLWLLLGIAGILEMLLISSNLNSYGKLGPAGSLDTVLHGNLFAIANVAPVALVFIVMFIHLFNPQKDILLVATLGVFVIGSLFANYTSDFQMSAWGLLAGFGIAVYLLNLLFVSIVAKYVGFFRKRQVPSTVPEREVAAR